MNEMAGLSAEELEELKDTEDWSDDEGEVRELTRADFARMKPFSSLPLELQAELLSLKGTVAPVVENEAS
jgi:hypothetical protein